MQGPDGKFYWQTTTQDGFGGAGGTQIVPWNGNPEDRGALNPASVDGVIKGGKYIEYEEGDTYKTAAEKEKKAEADKQAYETRLKLMATLNALVDQYKAVFRQPASAGSNFDKDGKVLPGAPAQANASNATANTTGGPNMGQVNKEGFELNETGSVTLTRHDGTTVTFDPETLLILEDNSMSGKLMESFGHASYMSEAELDEYGWQDFKGDVGDTARGAWQGLTLGTGNNIAAGLKSAFGPGTYKDELAKQVAADKAAQERSPWLYGGGNLAGALAMPVPGGALAAGIRNPLLRGAAHAGLNIGAQQLINKGVSAHNKSTLGYDPEKYPTTPEEVKAFQKANGLSPDGIIGPKTTAVLQKLGLTPPTVAEAIASLQAKLALLESAKPEYYYFTENGDVVNESGETVTDENIIGEIEWQGNLDEAWYNALGKLGQDAWKGIQSFGRGLAGRTNPNMLTPGVISKTSDAEKALNKVGRNINTGATKAATAIKNNPGKAALAGVAGAAALAGDGTTPGSQSAKPETPAAQQPNQEQEALKTSIRKAISDLQGINKDGKDVDINNAIRNALDVIGDKDTPAVAAQPIPGNTDPAKGAIDYNIANAPGAANIKLGN